MGKKVLVGAAVLAIVALAVLFFLPTGPDLSTYEALKEPRITRLPDQRMLEVQATGDPAVVGKQAFGQLFKTFYKIRQSGGGDAPAIPRARWPKPFDMPRTEWVGIYGLPVPPGVDSLPEQKGTFKPAITVWEYGEVAEILHIGSYASEAPAIERLLAFVRRQGYVVAGAHEEEYLRGPGLLSAGDPDRYYTIIRYRVQRSGR